MKRKILSVAMVGVLMAGAVSSASAYHKKSINEAKVELPGDSFRDGPCYFKYCFKIKGIFSLLAAPLMSPWELDGPIGRSRKWGDRKVE